MNLLFRLFFTVIASIYRKKVDLFGVCRTPFRCWPTDLDLYFHMNNGKYFSIMDIARTDLLFRSGLSKKMAQIGWYPVVVAETSRFYKSLQVFQRFEVETQVIAWDEKYIYLQQKFFKNEKLVCEAVVKALFLKKSGGVVRMDDLLKFVGVSEPSPKIPAWITAWNEQVQ